MSYSQKQLITLFNAGKVPGENTKPHHIETVISNVFIFADRVYKIYKNDNDFFNKSFRDISSASARFDFSRRDFGWNHSLSPSIYLELKGVTIADGALKFFEPTDAADELVMVMKRFEKKDVLFEKIMHGEINRDEAFAMGRELAETLSIAGMAIQQRHGRPTPGVGFGLAVGRGGELDHRL